ncbi:MAG TPA: hypothetical protein DCM33_06185 [Acinetobacter radioresistens]|nr:hypothetical protein [Acinetobacter radioresistens]
MSEALIQRLVEFAESGNQQKIVLAGQSYQGWIMEITVDALMISTGFNDKNGEDCWLKFDDLAIAELYFWNNLTSEWIRFTI